MLKVMELRQDRGSALAVLIVVVVFVGLALALQARIRSKISPDRRGAGSVSSQTHELAGWVERPYKIYLPANFSTLGSKRAIVALHGGGSNGDEQEKLTCPGGDLGSPKCLTAVATKNNFAVVYVNGTLTPGSKDARTFNAGGGDKGFRCVSTYACKNRVDDIAYFKDLIGDLEQRLGIGQREIYLTGMSNGAAMSHRLACQLPDKVKAIATVGGGNQFSTLETCGPDKALDVLVIHGTADPAWPYDGGESGTPLDKGIMVSIPATVSGWAALNGCVATPKAETSNQVASDQTDVTKQTYGGCKNGSRVIAYIINGGGHTWPQGNQYLSESRIGKTSQDINANVLMVEFFSR